MNAGCRQVEHLLETFIDGELALEQTLAVEAHLDGCERCGEQVALLESLRMGARRAVYEDAPVTPAFEERLRAALASEGHRAKAGAVPPPWLRRVKSGSARALLPVLAAAAVVLWFQARPEATKTAKSSAPPVKTAELVGIDQALDRLIDYHSAPPPAQVTEADDLPLFDRDVGVRVHAPRLEKFGASWEGAALVSVRNHQAASLRYRMPGRRITVYVYDPRKVTVNGSLPRRIVQDAPVYVGEWRGYTVAAKENHGIGYAMASDLDGETTAQVLTAIH